jgi:hypothetical protein
MADYRNTMASKENKASGEKNTTDTSKPSLKRIDTKQFRKYFLTFLALILAFCFVYYIFNKISTHSDKNSTSSEKATSADHLLETRTFSVTDEYPTIPQWNAVKGLRFSYDTDVDILIKDLKGHEYHCGPSRTDPIPDTELNKKLWFKAVAGTGEVTIYNIRYK